MTQTHPTLAQIIAAADAREKAARADDRDQPFAMQVAAAFPSMWEHPTFQRADICDINGQWTFSIGDIEFCVRWMRSVRGVGYWEFTAWEGRGCRSARDSHCYYAPDAETALLCFVGAVLRQARVIEGVA